MLEYESELLAFLLEGDDPVLVGLREQVRFLSVVSRDSSDGGVFTYFDVQPCAQRVTPASLRIDDVWFELVGDSEGGAAILWVREGAMDSLEVYANSGRWPSIPQVAALHYFGPERDLDALRSGWGCA